VVKGTEARCLSTRRVYEGKVLALDVDEVEEPGGVRATREVVRHRGSVMALPVHEDGRLVLVRQFRYAVNQEVWELPAGRLDPGESPEEGARRELEEEVGLRAGRMEHLGSFFSSPGFCDEIMHLYRASQLEVVPARPEPDERIEVRQCTLNEARHMVLAGEVRDAKTLVAILLEGDRQGGGRP